MRDLPLPDPGTPDHRSASHFLWWLVRQERGTVALGVVFGVAWMLSQALMPAVIGKAIDAGVTTKDMRALAGWAALLFGLGLLQSLAGVLRHRYAVYNFLSASLRTMQVTVRQIGRLGAVLPARLAAGEVVSIGTQDITQVGGAIDITARGTGGVVALITVAVILLNSSIPLGLVVVLGVPALALVVARLIRPLHHRQQEYRDHSGRLTSRATDIVTGLRVLRGIGGEATFAGAYRAQSQQVRAAGVAVARVESLLEGAQQLLPGLFVALVTWLGARFAVAGEIDVGQLIAFYGYAAFLLLPLRTLTEAADKMTRGHVAARRVVGLLSLRPDGRSEDSAPGADPAGGGDPVGAADQAAAPDGETLNGVGGLGLADPERGVVLAPGRLTAIAAASPADAIDLAQRLGGYQPSGARLRLPDGGHPGLSEVDRGELRRLILLADNEAHLFSGRLLDELCGPLPRAPELIAQALAAASADDIIDALPDGLATVIGESGREFSGGQQQRLRLARALLARAPVLILVEPTSAVDAHTEARIATRLREQRVGLTTALFTTSPLLLDHADHVLYVESGCVVAEGTHRALLDESSAYAACVTRGEDG